MHIKQHTVYAYSMNQNINGDFNQELRCGWDGRTVLHSSNSEKREIGQFSGKITREARVGGHESYMYIAKN